MSPWTAATRPTSHPLTHTRLAVRLNPARGDPARPFAPGDVLSGEAALVVDNEEGVKDVKHKLSVASVGVRVFWEARSHTEPVHSQEHHRGGSVFVPLTSGVEDVLLMPGIQGGDSVEATWSFEITLPEKSTVEESHNSSSKDKGKSSSQMQLAAGPPPSFAGETRSLEYILEAQVVFADGTESTELDERGHRVAGEMELITRSTFPFRPDGEKVMVSNEFQASQWKRTIDVTGHEGRSFGTLNVTINPPPLPIPASFPSIPLDVSLRLSPPAKVEKKKSLFGGLGKGKEKKKEEEAQAAAAASGQDAFVVESVTAKLVVSTTGDQDIVLSEVCSLNISSSHPTLSSAQGLSTEVHLDLASSTPSGWDATLGSFSLPNMSRQYLFSLSLQLSSPANPRSHPIVIDLPLPFIGAPYQPSAPAQHSSGAPPGFDDAPPPAGDPPSFADQSSQPPSFDGPPPPAVEHGEQPPSFEPPSFGAAMGTGSSRPSSSGPPGYH